MPKAAVAVAAALLIGGLLFLVVKKMVSDPLTTLRNGAERMKGGDPGYRITLDSADEFGELARAFNDMAEKAKTVQEHLAETSRTIEDLRDQKEFSEAIFNNAVSGMMVLSKNGIVIRINQAGSEILQITPERIIGRDITDMYPRISEMLTLSPDVGREVLVTLADATVRPIGYTNSLLLDKQGNERGIIIVFRDITEIKRLQSEIRKRQHFEAIGKVISGVAHEIRNPLFAIQAIAQILEREIESAQHQALIQAMLKETSRMRKLVEELLLYSRPSKLTVVEMNLELFAEELRAYMQTKYPDVPVSITVEPSSSMRGDRDRLLQVFQNLLDNAVGAQCTRIELVAHRKDDAVSVTVRDNGTGIKKSDMERVFDPFFTTKKDGTGLGLPICRKIIEDHGGMFELSSTEGEGTTAVVTFRL